LQLARRDLQLMLPIPSKFSLELNRSATVNSIKFWNAPKRPPPTPASTLELDNDFLAWEAAASRLLDGID
jgi:hypothetical protein